MMSIPRRRSRCGDAHGIRAVRVLITSSPYATLAFGLLPKVSPYTMVPPRPALDAPECLWLVIQSTLTWVDAHTEPWRWWALAVSTESIVLLTLGSLLAWRGGRWLRRIGWSFVGLASLSMLHHGLRAAFECLDAWRHGG